MDINKIIDGLGEKKEEIIKKAALCKNAEELLALAKENNVAIDERDAAELFASMQVKPGKLSDDELDAVAGGARFSKMRCTNNRCSTVQAGYEGSPCRNCGATIKLDGSF